MSRSADEIVEDVHAAVRALRARFGEPPATAVVLGSGLGVLHDLARDAESAEYAELNLPPTGVPGHAGQLVLGTVGANRVAFLSGRVHAYEGRPLDEVVRAVRAMHLWGARRVVLSSAVGSVRLDLREGDIVVVEDHINWMGRNPLFGPNLEALGRRFPDCTHVYDPELRAQAEAVGLEVGVELRAGVYGGMLGPSYETPAEVRALRIVGAHVVGMSMVMEALALAHCEAKVLGLAIVSNLGAGLIRAPMLHEDVTGAMERTSSRVARVLGALLERWE